MRWLFKWALRIGLVVAALVIVLLLARNSILRAVTEHRIERETGLQVRIGSFSSGLLSPVVTIENLKLYNTPEFGGTLFLDIPELHLQVDSVALAQRKLRLTLVRFNLAEIGVVRNEAGQTNIFSLMNTVKERAKKKRSRGDRDDFEFDGIDVLNLTLGKARFTDLKNPARNSEVALGMKNQVFRNVKSEADVYGMLFLVWLRSGGKFSLGPNELRRDYLERKSDTLDHTFRETLQRAAEPASVNR